MSTNRSAKHVVTKIVALLASDYTARFAIGGTEDVPYGQRLSITDEAKDEEFIITVQKRNTGEAIVASTADGRVVVDEALAGDDDGVVKEEEPF